MPSLLSAPLRSVGKMKHAGRTRSKYQFDASDISVYGLPEMLDGGSKELVVQLARGPKIAQCSVDVADGRPVGGCVHWGEKKLSFVATLYTSKTGKAFSDKRYRATLHVAKPAAFGTSKRALREIAHVDFNVADHVSSAPARVVLHLPLSKGARGASKGVAGSIELSLELRAVHLGTADAEDEDDDDRSISSAITGFSDGSSYRESPSEAPSEGALEQDLDGFDAMGEASAGTGGMAESSAGLSGVRARAAPVALQAGGLSASEAIAARQKGGAAALPPAATARDMGAAALSARRCWSSAKTSSASANPFDDGAAPNPVRVLNPFDEAPADDSRSDGARPSDAAEDAVAAEQSDAEPLAPQAGRTQRETARVSDGESHVLRQQAGAQRGQLEALQAQVAALAASERAALDLLGAAEAEAEEARRQLLEAAEDLQAARDGGAHEEQYTELALQLVDAKLAAAQYAYERDEARARCKKVRAGGTAVAEQLTALEVRYEDLKRRYEADLTGLIEVKLQCAEACARVAELEDSVAR